MGNEDCPYCGKCKHCGRADKKETPPSIPPFTLPPFKYGDPVEPFPYHKKTKPYYRIESLSGSQ